MIKLKLIALITIFFLIFAPLTALQNNILDSIAIISDYSGVCFIKNKNIKEFKNVELNMPIFKGDILKTGKDSYIEITFDDATIIKLDSDTILQVNDLMRKENIARTILNLTWGRLLAIVDKLKSPQSVFEVHTKMAIAAVKGTELAVEVNDNETLLGVYEGKVKFLGKDEKGNKIDGVEVTKGNESKVLKDKRQPTTPERLKAMLHIEKQFNKLREEIKIIREIREREGKEGVIKFRMKKKLEKEGKTKVESETEITIGDKNENINQVENRIKEHLRKKIKSEFRYLREHAYNDVKWVNNEMKADLNLGKTMTDVHGNRIRIEEYIFRPNPKQVDLLSITFRKDRLDYLRAQNIFNTDLPKKIPLWVWQKEWFIKPSIYKLEERIRFSNTIDYVDTLVKYGYDNYVPSPTANPLPIEQTYVPEPVKIDNIWKLLEYETLLAINGDVKEHRKQIVRRDNFQQKIREWVKMPDDKTFKDNYEIVNASYATNDHSYSYNISTPFSIVDTPINPGTNDLAWNQKRYYNDGSWLEIKLYLIDDYGNIKQYPTTLLSWASLIFDTNIEMILNSNEFKLGDIDIVSQILWWVMINPKEKNARPDSSVDATAF